MKAFNAPLLALLLCLPLAACGERPSHADAPDADTTLGQKVREATDKARKELAEKNISVSSKDGVKVEISPTGDLLIDGKAIAIDVAQRRLLLQYREQMVKDLGKQNSSSRPPRRRPRKSAQSAPGNNAPAAE